MESNCEYIPYQQTGYFSNIILDYLQADEKLKPFYAHPVSIAGIEAAIAARQQYQNHRPLLVQQLQKQYDGIELSAPQQVNLDRLLLHNTFTICTAHQPNIFTGHLYFIYKILHAVKLANHLAEQLPQHHFVPVYYMGSEDADLEELGHINLFGENLEWHTEQTGAVGRMLVDDQLISLIDTMAGQLEVQPHGKALISLLRAAYQPGITIQQATLVLVNALFSQYGLLVLLPDNADLKRPFSDIVKKELATQFSHPLVEATGGQLSDNYKIQAAGRDINLFYLSGDKRERIELADGKFVVKRERLQWTLEELMQLADDHPEKFSANVILRGVFQEMILPNIAFIGGGGEIAYWLELKAVFEACQVPFPVLIVRNSFVIANQAQVQKLTNLNLTLAKLFSPTDTLVNELVHRQSKLQLQLTGEIGEAKAFYEKLQHVTGTIDQTLTRHVAALKTGAEKSLITLEKKMLKAEKKKFEAQHRQIKKLKQHLFPGDSLQERVDNFAVFYAHYGSDWLEVIYQHSQALEQQFGLLTLP